MFVRVAVRRITKLRSVVRIPKRMRRLVGLFGQISERVVKSHILNRRVHVVHRAETQSVLGHRVVDGIPPSAQPRLKIGDFENIVIIESKFRHARIQIVTIFGIKLIRKGVAQKFIHRIEGTEIARSEEKNRLPFREHAGPRFSQKRGVRFQSRRVEQFCLSDGDPLARFVKIRIRNARQRDPRRLLEEKYQLVDRRLHGTGRIFGIKHFIGGLSVFDEKSVRLYGIVFMRLAFAAQLHFIRIVRSVFLVFPLRTCRKNGKR